MDVYVYVCVYIKTLKSTTTYIEYKIGINVIHSLLEGKIGHRVKQLIQSNILV